MDKICVFALALIAVVLPANTQSQTKQSPLDHYLDTGKTIVVGKCLSVGPINILLKADVEVEILHVVKGNETLRKISVESQYAMVPGELYLLRTEKEAHASRDYFTVTTIDSAIQIWRGEDIAELKTLSPRILVLRTMNLRVDTLESEIRRRTWELDALKAARREN